MKIERKTGKSLPKENISDFHDEMRNKKEV